MLLEIQTGLLGEQHSAGTSCEGNANAQPLQQMYSLLNTHLAPAAKGSNIRTQIRGEHGLGKERSRL